jgi:hypothetical protein
VEVESHGMDYRGHAKGDSLTEDEEFLRLYLLLRLGLEGRHFEINERELTAIMTATR